MPRAVRDRGLGTSQVGIMSASEQLSAGIRLEILPLEDPDNDTCMTFVMHKEDHTLGNALRYMIMKNSDVTFCGYSVPHPSENKINLRIQTNGIPAVEALKKGLEDLHDLCGHVLHTFEESVEQFKQHQEMECEDGGMT